MASIFGLFFLMSSTVYAASISVEPLFDVKSRIPGVLIPFRVTGDVIATGNLLSVQAEGQGDVDCRAMLDPFIKDIFHIKCNRAATINVSVRATGPGGNLYQANIQALEIKYPSAGLTRVRPTPRDPEILAGMDLFNSYCLRCHTVPEDKAGRTANQITAAIWNDSIGQMKNDRPVLSTLSADQINKIAAYLESLR